MHAHLLACEGGLAAVWRGKHDAHAGTPLPVDVLTEALSSASYTTTDDLDGATVDELLRNGVPHGDAVAALTYLESLSQP